MKDIRLGFEVETGKVVNVKPSHIIVGGLTHLSGKSTTLEGLLDRSGCKAIVFKTKIGEKAFTEGTLIPPYFKERSDWQFIQSLVEAALKERVKWERSWIIRLSKDEPGLLEFRSRIKELLAKEKKLRAMDRDMLTNLGAYLDLILPEIQYANFSKTLELSDGINIVDLEKYRDEVQHLVISSTMEEVLNNHTDTIVVMPEAWKHLPQGRGTPCKLAAVSFIRQGATNNNYLWIDSQDITGVDKEPLKQVSTWILGLQTEKNEVVRTLDQVPLPKSAKPKPEEIMTLERGHFFVCTPKETIKVYAQPAWLDEKTAKQIAKGEKSVDDVARPEKLVPHTVKRATAPAPTPAVGTPQEYTRLQKDIVEMRNDFFDKVNEVRDYTNKVGLEVMNLKKQLPDENVIVSKVLQKMPQPNNVPPVVDKEAIVREVLAQVPKAAGAVTYEVAPVEKIQKDFLEETKNVLLGDISGLDAEQKKILKFVETANKGVTATEITERALFKKVGGGTMQKTRNLCKDMHNKNLVRYDTAHGKVFQMLKDRIKDRLAFHGASDQEIQQVYDHVMMEMLGG